VQALIATTTVVVSDAVARRGDIDAGVVERLTPALENAQLAWSRSARRWAELTTPASRTDPALVEAASQLRAAIGAAVANQTGWATPDEIAGRIDLPATVMTLHRSMVAGVELAYVTREIAADHPGLAAPARVIAMRAQGEAEVAIEQGETRFEGVRWVTPHQIAANQLIPLPEPARRGLINAATDVAEATNQAVAAAAHLRPTEHVPRGCRRCSAGWPSCHGTRDSGPSFQPKRSLTMSRATLAANGGGITAELRKWARGCHSTEAAVELLIRARGGRFLEPGQPWLRTDDRRNHLARRPGHRAVLKCRVLRRTPHSGTRRGPRTWQAARRCGPVSWAAWTPTISDSSLPSCGTPALAAGLDGP
jgi:hypothetical protein